MSFDDHVDCCPFITELWSHGDLAVVSAGSAAGSLRLQFQTRNYLLEMKPRSLASAKARKCWNSGVPDRACSRNFSSACVRL